MTLNNVEVSRVATALNALMVIIQYTFGLSLVVILIYCLYTMNSAISWSSLARQLHSSLWPDLLRSDSARLKGEDRYMTVLMWLGLLGSLLAVISSIVSPLGLDEGPLVPREEASIPTMYVPDLSPMGLGTSPRSKHRYSHRCGIRYPFEYCPDNPDALSMEIPVSTIQKFNSTSYSPFHMQFRRYILSRNLTIGDISIVESILLRNGTFAVEGLLVDMTESPGIGLRNHTVPQVSHGGVWSEDILWLEPQTSCVNTNITIDFSLDIDAQAIGTINITDHGGFSNLPPENNVNIATSDHNIDHPGAVNLAYRAYKTAVMINRVALQSLPAMNPPEFGKTVVIGRFEDHPFIHDRMHVLGLSAYVNTTARDAATQEIEAWCRGYNINGSTNASINTPSIHCQVFLSAPIPHKDPSLLMSQYLTVCASSVRASVQRVEFSFNETGALNNIQIQGRKRSNSTIWGVENTTMTMRDVNLFWGAVSSRYENDTSLSTIRSETLYLPAGQSDFTLSSSNDSPSSIPSAIWNRLYSPVTLSGYDFAGVGRFNLQMKWRSFLHKDIAGGAAITLKQIWTDIAVNNLVGTSVTETASVRPYGPSVTYNFRYSVPFFLLCAIWLPILLLTSVVFIKGRIKPSYIRHILNQTSLGRVVVDDSLLWVVNSGQRSEGGASPSDTGTRTSPRTKSIVSASPTHQVPLRTAVWAITLGKKLVRFGPPSSVLRGSNGNQRDNTTGSPDASVNPRNTSIRVALEYLVRLEKTRDDRGQTSDLS